MFVRSWGVFCCLCMGAQLAMADVDMLRLQQLLEASKQMELESQARHALHQDDAASHEVSTSGMPMPIRVLIDVRSTHSDGKHDMETLSHWAKERAIDSLAFTEHDRYSIRFGIDPIPNILGYAMQHPSLYVTGLDVFFTDLNRIRARHPDMQYFAGTESTPGYTWSGIPFLDLSLHNAERHLITLGIETPAQVEGLSSYDLRHGYGNHTVSLIFWCVIAFALVIFFLRRRKRAIALFLMVSWIVFFAIWQMRPKVDADVDFIRTAHEQQLFVIWTHPGTLSGVREGTMGVQLDTPPYSKRVFQDPTADAFTAVYGDTDSNTAPGGLWDRYMVDYLHGYHKKPIWAVAAGDYHEQGMAGEYLGNFPMDVWGKSSKSKDVLAALRQGHMAAWGMGKDDNIGLSVLYLQDADGQKIYPGDEVHARSPIRAVMGVLQKVKGEGKTQQLESQWVVDGHVIGTQFLAMGQAQSITLPLSQGAHVVRAQVAQSVRMVANPFLVHVQ